MADMIGRLYGWLSGRTFAARPGRSPVGPDGLSAMQRDCERRLVTALTAVGHHLHARSLEPEPDGRATLRARLSGTEVEVLIRPEGAEVVGPDLRLDFADWAHRPPAEVTASFVDAIIPIVTNVRTVRTVH